MELESKGPGVATLRRYAAVLVSGLLLVAPVAQAQNYEGYYGNTEWRDIGEDVKTVKYCPGNGSIAVGTRRNSDADQVLVTRVSDTGVTDNAGLNTWQQAYYVGGGKHSAGYGIIELAGGAGFAVTGSLRTDEGSYAFVMRLDCKGNPQWTTLLDNRDQTSRATGYDLIQSGSVMPSRAAAGGDIVMVGEEIQNGRTVGRIARVDLTGNVVWDHQYDGHEWPALQFRAVTENLANTGAWTDLVIAGTATSANGVRNALMFRATGAGAPVCSTTLGDEKEHRDFNGLTPLLGRNFLGETVLVGAATGFSEGAPSQPYLVRYSRASCSPKVQAVWNDREKASFTAYDVVEAATLDGLNGALAVVGTIGSSQGFVLAADPATLREYGALVQRRYGDNFRESLYAIDRKADRFIMAGATGADWAGEGDPQDLYLVQVDAALYTQCADQWYPQAVNVDLPPKDLWPQYERVEKFFAAQTPPDKASKWGYACELDPPEGCPGVIDNGTVMLGVHPTAYLNIECPAIPMSSGLYGTTLVGLRFLPTNGEASAPGTPCEGWGVANADPAAPVSGHTSRCNGTVNMVVNSFTTPASPPIDTANSVVTVANTFRVTHRFTPAPQTPYLYRVDVSIQNVSSKAIKDLRYTRGIDYDVPPNTFSEYITLAGSSPLLFAWNTNGFTSLDPLAIHPSSGAVTDSGPSDRGSHMDFRLGSLAVGATRSFVTYYGAAPTERDALNALGLVNAGLYSLGQANWDGSSPWNAPLPGIDGRDNGRPGTFMYGLQTR